MSPPLGPIKKNTERRGAARSFVRTGAGTSGRFSAIAKSPGSWGRSRLGVPIGEQGLALPASENPGILGDPVRANRDEDVPLCAEAASGRTPAVKAEVEVRMNRTAAAFLIPRPF